MNTNSTAEKNLERHIPSLISLWRQNGKSSPLSSLELSSVSSSLLSLQRGLTGNRQLAGAGYMENDSLFGAYLLYYWPVSYMQISYASSFAKESFKLIAQKAAHQKQPVKILDLGSGPAPASCALLDLLLPEYCADTFQADLTLADSSAKALSLAEKLIKKEFPSVCIQTNVCDFEKTQPSSDVQYDIIVMSHALNELWKDKKDCIELRKSFLAEAVLSLRDGGILFLCEPALLQTSRNLIALRDSLLSENLRIIAPCPHVFRKIDDISSPCCPALAAGASHTCHAELPWIPAEPVASIAKKAGLDRESVKMTFFIFGKDKNAPQAKSKDGQLAGRVVSEGMLNKSGRIRFLLCNGSERIPLSAKSGDAYAKQIGFFNLKRYDFITVTKPECRNQGGPNNSAEHVSYGIGAETQLTVQQ
jgi:hypothetical protein